jgi:hypothetical protein
MFIFKLQLFIKDISFIFIEIFKFIPIALFSLLINILYIPVWILNCFKFVIRKFAILRFRTNLIKYGALTTVPFIVIHILADGLFPFVYPSFGLNMLAFVTPGITLFMSNPTLLFNFGGHYRIDTTPSGFYGIFVFLSLVTILLFFLSFSYILYYTNYVSFLSRTQTRSEVSKLNNDKDFEKSLEAIDDFDLLPQEEEVSIKRAYEPLVIFFLFVAIVLFYATLEYHFTQIRFTFRMWPYWLDLTPWFTLDVYDDDYLDEVAAQTSNWKFIDSIKNIYLGARIHKRQWVYSDFKNPFKKKKPIIFYYIRRIKRKKKNKKLFYQVWHYRIRKEGRMRYFFRGLINNRPIIEFIQGIKFYFKRVIPKWYKKSYRKHIKEGGIFVRWFNRVAYFLFLRPLLQLKDANPKFFYKHQHYIRPFVKFIAYVFLIRGEEKIDRGTRHEYPPINAEDPETKKRLEKFFKWLEENKF